MKRVIFCLAILLCFIVSSQAECQVKKCIRDYMQELDQMPDINSHCRRLKYVFDCFWSENPDCTPGKAIKRWRGWVLMVATLEKLLNMCPIDNQLLQTYYNKLPENSKPNRLYNYLQTTSISDVDKECAKRVHVKCNKMFVEAVKTNHLICEDGRKWLECYKTSNCDQESAIVRYAKYVGKLVTDLVGDCNRATKSEF